jgi:hypothetical protein
MAEATEHRVAHAIDLGWRMAELFALNVAYEPGERSRQLLPSRNSLSRRDRLELELLAADGAARRLGVDLCEDHLVELRALADRAAGRDGQESAFREALERCHVALDKSLWTQSEAEGRGYELGIMLSDSYNRICRVYHRHPDAIRDEWLAVFGDERATMLRTLLDNLQSRLDPGAVTVVRDHLNVWRDRVRVALVDDAGAQPPPEAAIAELRSQTIVWRQLLTGDKQPEAFLGPQARARVRDELLHMMWQRYRVWTATLSTVIAAATVAAILWHSQLGDMYGDNKKEVALATSVLISLAGALGISKASINRAIKQDLRKWSALLWNRALSRVVCTETLRIDWVFPQPPRHLWALRAIPRQARELRPELSVGYQELRARVGAAQRAAPISLRRRQS